jgi:hypothetical protein
VNREVQVAPAATGVGERNDLLVQCSAGGTGEPFSVVIEVKGAWNAELKTAADQQLAKRYLDAETRRCGIYLVFFFDREMWAKDDGRRKRCAKPKAELCQLFDEQAAELSADGTLAVRAFVMDASIRPPRPK